MDAAVIYKNILTYGIGYCNIIYFMQINLVLFSLHTRHSFAYGFFSAPFRECVSSKQSKKTNNPNPSPIKKIRFGFVLFAYGIESKPNAVGLIRKRKNNTIGRSDAACRGR